MIPEESQTKCRVLVFVVAYEAQKHLSSVLARIPEDLINNDSIEILVIDDGSSDAGVIVGSAWARQHDAQNVSILRNPVNQGYGGNQKLGYRIAIEAGFDYVVLLHGDGQYAPELLPHFIDVWKNRDADVVLGSRMQDLKSARRGGMPWYKLIGNQVLTWLQNFVTGQKLSEYHTGYRGYSTRFLRSVPFELNTNDFHFDTEILLQAFHARATVEEFAIPTHYGDEICRVNGVRYAKNVVFSTLHYKMHQMGMLCDLRYRRLEVARYEDKTFMAYSSHATALRLVESFKPARLMDLGCGPGFLARRCEAMGIEVTAVDIAPPQPGMVKHFRQMNLETDRVPVDAMSHDMILMLDVIEHLAEPEKFLLELRNQSEPAEGGKMPAVVISTPNIAFAAIRLNLLLGRFTYAERGILDITHKRLFTKNSLRRALRECGYKVEKFIPIGVPFQAVMPGTIGRLLGSGAAMLARVWPSMFAFQLMVVCRPSPGIRYLLRVSERHRLAQGAVLKALNAQDCREVR
jgi:glycosyltransferase involved in cell wall biosynthesis